MAKVLRLAFLAVVSFTVSAEAATGGRLLLFSDASLSQCALVDNSFQVADIFIVHDLELDSKLIRFRLEASSGFNGTWIDDIVPSGVTVIAGDSPTGIQLDYGECPTDALLILRARYQLFGSSTPCSYLRTVAYPGDGSIEMMTCHFDNWPVDADTLFVNADETCPCSSSVGVETTTWGRVKALYRD